MTITRNKTRSLLTCFGVFWGILMLVILLGAGNGMKNAMFSNINGFATNSAFFFSDRTSESYKGFNKGRQWDMRNRDVESIPETGEGHRGRLPHHLGKSLGQEYRFRPIKRYL